jgi:hypothetical protein
VVIAILGELKVYIEENHSALKNNFEDVKKTGSKIIRNSLPLILKQKAGYQKQLNWINPL